jgi:hypothetical protein
MLKEMNDMIKILDVQSIPSGGEKNTFFLEHKLTSYSDNRNLSS